MIKDIKKYLFDILEEFQDDGSREKALRFIDQLNLAEEMESLLSSSPAFKKVVENITSDLRSRLTDLVDKDPELKALKNVLTQTLGSKNASARIKAEIESYLET